MTGGSAPTELLHVAQRREGAAVVVCAEGEIDTVTAPVLVQQFVLAIENAVPPGPIVADLRDVEFFDARGIAVLVDTARVCLREHTTLHVVPGRAVSRTLALVDAHKELTVCPTLATALVS